MSTNYLTQFYNENYESDYWGGFLIITDKQNPESPYRVQLRNSKGRNVTLDHFKNCVKSHGFDKACETFIRLSPDNK